MTIDSRLSGGATHAPSYSFAAAPDKSCHLHSCPQQRPYCRVRGLVVDGLSNAPSTGEASAARSTAGTGIGLAARHRHERRRPS